MIIYEDEYGNEFQYRQTTIIPNVGDAVIIDEEEYRVKSRTLYPKVDSIVIIITQSIGRTSVAESSDTGRLSRLQSAIIETNKRQDAVEKKQRTLGEQISTVRRHVNQQIQKDNKATKEKADDKA